jgi:hypothetical protein
VAKEDVDMTDRRKEDLARHRADAAVGLRVDATGDADEPITEKQAASCATSPSARGSRSTAT